MADGSSPEISRHVRPLTSEEIQQGSSPGRRPKETHVRPMTEKERYQAAADTGVLPPDRTSAVTGEMSRREMLKKGGWALGGVLAAAAGVFGLSKAFEKAWFSKEPSIEAGKKAAQDYSSSTKKQAEVHGNSTGPLQPKP